LQSINSSHRPRKRFGQNFLTDQEVIASILHAINIRPDHHVVEIGPGLGALTTKLIKQAVRFDAIEIDRDLVAILAGLFTNNPFAQLYQADALSFDFAALTASPNSYRFCPLRIVGNLPYNISTPLLFHLISFARVIRDMHFMLQQEVATRLATTVHDPFFDAKQYGRLSVMVQCYCKVEILFNVPPSVFSPSPQIQSSFVRLTPLTCPLCDVNDLKMFADIVRIAFNQRRKTIRNSLRELLDENAWKRLNVISGIDPQLRPEQLSVEQFVMISKLATRKI